MKLKQVIQLKYSPYSKNDRAIVSNISVYVRIINDHIRTFEDYYRTMGDG